MNGSLVPDVGSLGTLVSFGEDALGNLYAVDYHLTNGEIFRIETGQPDLPGLSQWGLIGLCVGLLLVASWTFTPSRMRA